MNSKIRQRCILVGEMAVLKVYGDKIGIRSISQGQEDEHGNYIEGSLGDWVEIDGCECIPNAGGESEIAFDDGVVSKYTYTIYLPKDCIELKKGDRVRIYRFGSTTESTIKGFIRYQHQCKAWA